ncbi:hypothetical protein [Idiomarina sp. UBA3162]|uniref:hypothetical protein n=1 Tax=unclassified Idiomarina TaxID=2614829 RepID=UPI000C8BB5CB|nr:hypothetical protein [Idiomarina sp. UBA3162]MAD54065.1 hypothetical protein [Idiomarinaceae bacterium]MEC7642938.1 hypothetical protein [Pseudomonadota bacterium]|tara:strand:+ start:1526 stop:1768 length:243 start_codon:yes stop_codon:yes gene_type:complete
MVEQKYPKRKIVLMNGDDVLGTRLVDGDKSMFATLRLIRDEFKYFPTMTKVLLKDLSGREWTIYRYDTTLRKLLIGYRAK